MNENLSTAGKAPLNSPTSYFKWAWGNFKTHYQSLVPIILIGGIGVYAGLIMNLLDKSPEGTIAKCEGVIGGAANCAAQSGPEGALAIVILIVTLVALLWSSTALIYRIHNLDKPMSIGEAFTMSLKYVWPMILAGFVAAMGTIIGLILLIIPGIIIGVWLSLTSFIVVAENKRPIAALQASKDYVTGYWWPVFGRLVFIALFMIVISIVVGIISTIIAGEKGGPLIQQLIGLVLTPIAVLYEYALYKNLKDIKSGAVTVEAVEVPAAV